MASVTDSAVSGEPASVTDSAVSGAGLGYRLGRVGRAGLGDRLGRVGRRLLPQEPVGDPTASVLGAVRRSGRLPFGPVLPVLLVLRWSVLAIRRA